MPRQESNSQQTNYLKLRRLLRRRKNLKFLGILAHLQPIDYSFLYRNSHNSDLVWDTARTNLNYVAKFLLRQLFPIQRNALDRLTSEVSGLKIRFRVQKRPNDVPERQTFVLDRFQSSSFLRQLTGSNEIHHTMGDDFHHQDKNSYIYRPRRLPRNPIHPDIGDLSAFGKHMDFCLNKAFTD